MSKFQVCDRCGAKVATFSESGHVWAYLYRCRWRKLVIMETGKEEKNYDLCGGCAKALQIFLEQKGV